MKINRFGQISSLKLRLMYGAWLTKIRTIFSFLFIRMDNNCYDDRLRTVVVEILFVIIFVRKIILIIIV